MYHSVNIKKYPAVCSQGECISYDYNSDCCPKLNYVKETQRFATNAENTFLKENRASQC
jgi:hypothetical protein